MKKIIKSTLLLTVFSTLLFIVACTGQAGDPSKESAMEAKNEATVRAVLAGMDAGDVTKFDLYCAPDFQIHNPFLATPGALDVFKGLMQGQKAGFPDVKHEVVQIFSKGNMVCVRGIFSGTNTGSMQGNPPTGNKVVIPFIFTDEFNAAGKLIVRHVQFDTGAFNAQLMAKK